MEYSPSKHLIGGKMDDKTLQKWHFIKNRMNKWEETAAEMQPWNSQQQKGMVMVVKVGCVCVWGEGGCIIY